MTQHRGGIAPPADTACRESSHVGSHGASLGSDLQAVHALRVIDAIRRELGRYYGTIALINLGLGAATAVAMIGCPL